MANALGSRPCRHPGVSRMLGRFFVCVHVGNRRRRREREREREQRESETRREREIVLAPFGTAVEQSDPSLLSNLSPILCNFSLMFPWYGYGHGYGSRGTRGWSKSWGRREHQGRERAPVGELVEPEAVHCSSYMQMAEQK